MGLIEHRGRFYRFEDLMDPVFRATSTDPFVQTFCEPSRLADPRAGLGDERETSGDFEIRRWEIWRTQSITIDIHDVEALGDRLPTVPAAGDGPHRDD